MPHTLSQGRQGTRITALLSILGLILAILASSITPAAASERDQLVPVIVRTVDSTAAAALVESVGGNVGTSFEVIDGFEAEIPQDLLADLESSPPIAAITIDAQLQLTAAGWGDAGDISGLDPKAYPGALFEITEHTRAREQWQRGNTGAGVDVALIDSGVAPVHGLLDGKVVNGPDLSFEGQHDSLRYLDTFGHGTHMAGIIAGHDSAVTSDYKAASQDHFMGMAPDARIVSIKVADAHGVTDVSQVIAAIDWVVQHGQEDGLNIRVMNLSFGTDSTQSYVLDPLSFAVQRAWDAGIVVVVAAGNDGNDFALRNPASNPSVIAVGSFHSDAFGGHKRVSDFSNCGTSSRGVDIVAHGVSIASLAAPGSRAQLDHPGSVVLDRLMLGSGTSQSAAVVSGAAALLISQHPSITPDQVKALMQDSALTVKEASDLCQGAGVLKIDPKKTERVPSQAASEQHHLSVTGLGTLEGARGSDHLTADGVTLEGEKDIHGNVWEPAEYVTDSLAGTSWSGGDWNGTSWSGTSWSGTSWSGLSWSGTSWSGTSWSGTSWSGTSWSGGAWSDAYWNGTSWSGTSWSGTSWSGTSWSGTSWSGTSWSTPMTFGVRWD